MSSLEGKVAVVVGVAPTGNIGAAIAARFRDLGASVVIAGRDAAGIQEAAGAIRLHGQRCDITREDDLLALTDAVKRRHGRIDIAVNAVGMNLVRPFLDVTRDELERVVAAQLTGTFLFMQAMIRAMEHGGSIIQISSVTSQRLLPDHAVYMATKAAGDMVVRSAAFDFGHRGLRINSLSPSATLDAPMTAPFMNDPAIRDEITALVPLGRLGTMEDVANAAAWLAGDHCFMTGENLQINGGSGIPAFDSPPRG